MSDKKDRKQDEAKHSMPRHESSELGDRSKSVTSKDYSEDGLKRPSKENIDGDSQRTNEKARKASGSNPGSKKQSERKN